MHRWGAPQGSVDVTDGPPLWRLRWRRHGPPSSLPTLSGWVTSLAVFESEATGGPCAVAGSSGGDVAVVDLVHGRPGGPVIRVGPWVNGVGAVRLPDRQAIVVAEARGALRLLDPVTGEERGPVMVSSSWGARRLWTLACIRSHGSPVAVVGISTGELEFWDLALGRLASGQGSLGPRGVGITQVAAREIDGSVLVATGSATGHFAVFRVIGGSAEMPHHLALELLHQHAPDDPAFYHVDAMAIAELDGDPVLLTSANRKARAWDLRSGQPLGPAFAGHSGYVRSLAIVAVEGRQAVLSGGDDGTVRAWDPVTGAEVGEPIQLDGLTARMTAEARVGDRTVLVTGTGTGQIELWELGGPPPSAPDAGDAWWAGKGYPTRAADAELDGRPVAVVGFSDGAVRAFDLAGGTLVRGPITSGGKGVRGLAVVTVGDRSLVAWGSAELLRHDLASGEPAGAPLPLDVHALAAAVVDGRPVLVVGRESGELARLDAETLAPLGEPMTGHRGQVWGIAVADVEGRPVALSASQDGTVALWDLRTGRAIRRRLTEHPGGAYAVAAGSIEGVPCAFTGGHTGLVDRVDLRDALREPRWPFRRSPRSRVPVLQVGETVTALGLATVDGRPWLVVGASTRAAEGTGSSILWVDLDRGSHPRQKVPVTGLVDGFAAATGTLVVAAEEGLLAYAAEP